jgi:tryptophan 2,3-dioxygenase
VTGAWLVSITTPKDRTFTNFERMIDLDHRFQLWRFQHMKTVERIIGYKPGRGTAGVYLARRCGSGSFRSCGRCGPDVAAWRFHGRQPSNTARIAA